MCETFGSVFTESDAPKTTLNDLETFTPAVHEVLDGHANVLVNNLTMALGSVVVAKDTHGADDLHTRRVRGNDDYALLAVLVRVVGIALAKYEMESTAWVTSTANVPRSPLR